MPRCCDIWVVAAKQLSIRYEPQDIFDRPARCLRGLAMKLSAAALTVMLATGVSTQALSQTPTTVMGFADTSCATWTQERTNHQSQRMEDWALGFASGADGVLSQSGSPDFLKNVEGHDALFSWIDNYCRSNPREVFPIAVMNLIIELRKGTHLVGYKIDPEYTQTSPDGAITIEQYVNKDTDDYNWQFWVRRKDRFTLLDEQPDYPAGFRFTNDLKWLVRMQKTGSGESTLYLYRLAPQGYVPATKKPLGDLAWAYMKSRPDWRKVKKEPEYHMSVNLLKGTEENYRWLGVDWPENRYLLIGLSGDADIKGRKPQQTGVVNDWRCRYDLQTGKFDVPPLFSNDNAKAVVPQ